MSKILFIDDEEEILNVFKDFFIEEYPECFYANSGQEGIELYMNNKSCLDLIVLDYKMPELTGFDVLQEIRKMNKNIPILFYTGMCDVVLRAKLLNAGAVDVVFKGDLDRLNKSIRLVISELMGPEIVELDLNRIKTLLTLRQASRKT